MSAQDKSTIDNLANMYFPTNIVGNSANSQPGVTSDIPIFGDVHNENYTITYYNFNPYDPGTINSSVIIIPLANTDMGYAGLISATDKTKLDLVVTDGDGTQFLSDDGTYKEIIIPESTLSDDYTASAESSEPAAGDTYETAISKLHKTILDLTSRIADLEQALTLKTV